MSRRAASFFLFIRLRPSSSIILVGWKTKLLEKIIFVHLEKKGSVLASWGRFGVRYFQLIEPTEERYVISHWRKDSVSVGTSKHHNKTVIMTRAITRMRMRMNSEHCFHGWWWPWWPGPRPWPWPWPWPCLSLSTVIMTTAKTMTMRNRKRANRFHGWGARVLEVKLHRLFLFLRHIWIHLDIASKHQVTSHIICPFIIATMMHI